MKVFISWSGKFSKECAEVLRDWIKCTLQASEPWISSKDIDKGSLWFNEISDQLRDTKVGIVCLTKDNKEKPWILFESGALAKGISANRVCTFLINLKPSDIDNPMAQFNHTLPDQEGMKALLYTINNELGDNALEEKILDQVFDTYWDSFENKFKKIIETAPAENAEIPTRSNDDMLEEILYTTRTLDKRIRAIERDKDGSMIRRRIPRSEAERLVDNLIEEGLEIEDIEFELKGKAPSGFVKKYATTGLNKKLFREDESEENA